MRSRLAIIVTTALMLAGCTKSEPSAAPSQGAAATTPTTAATSGTSIPSASATSSKPTTTAPAIDAAIRAYGDCTKPSVQPAEIVLTCADYGEVLQGLQWLSWTSASATAVGTLSYNDCTPDCGSGHFHQVPGTRVTLTHPVHGAGGRLVWSRVQEAPEPPGYATGPFHGGPQPLFTKPA